MLATLSGRPKEDWQLTNDDLPELSVLRKRLASVDQLFLEVFARRLRLALLVEERKRRDALESEDPEKQEEKARIYRKKVETDRIAQARQ